jgi:hypothetical protein
MSEHVTINKAEVEQDVAAQIKSGKMVGNDNFVGFMKTNHQNHRDYLTSLFFQNYVNTQKDKLDFRNKWRKVLSIGAGISVMIIVLALMILPVIFIFVMPQKNTVFENIITLIATIVPLTSALIGILTIVTKYVFPENDDQSVTDIVKAILSNDYENRKLDIAHEENSKI